MYGKNRIKNTKKTIHELLTSKFKLLDKKAIKLFFTCSSSLFVVYLCHTVNFKNKHIHKNIYRATAQQKNTAISEREGKTVTELEKKKEFKLSSHLDYTN
jgi:hypothetical protein